MSEHGYPPWEPPFAGTESEHVLGSLHRLRVTFRWKVDGLDAAQLGARLPASALTLGGLVKHVAVQEDYASAVKIDGVPMPSVWGDNGWDDDQDWEFSSAADHSPRELYELYDGAVDRADARIRAAVAERGLAGPSAVTLDDGTKASIRRILFDLIEEYARHTGHADILREAVDGRVGEDPPSDWQPQA